MPFVPTCAFPTVRQIAVALIALMFTVVPRTGAAQDSRIGLYHQTLFPSRDSGSTSVSGNQVQGSIYGSERAGGWGFAFREPWYTSATVGPFYDVTEWLEVGVALVAQAPVERFDMRVVRGFSRPCEIELHAAVERPCFQRFRHELRAVIDRNRGRIALLGADRLQGRDDITAGE